MLLLFVLEFQLLLDVLTQPCDTRKEQSVWVAPRKYTPEAMHACLRQEGKRVGTGGALAPWEKSAFVIT